MSPTKHQPGVHTCLNAVRVLIAQYIQLATQSLSEMKNLKYFKMSNDSTTKSITAD